VNTGLRRFVPGASQEAPPARPAEEPAPGEAGLAGQATPAAPAGQAPPSQAAAGLATAAGLAPAGGLVPAGGPVPMAGPATAGRPAPGDPARQAPEEKCEFCATPVAAEHGHVADLETSTLMCACRACYLLFTHSGAGQTWQQDPQPEQEKRIGRARYRAIPDRYRSDPGHPLTLAEWDALEIPVGLAFFLRGSAGETTAFYPSPAGATECRLDLDAWGRIAGEHPLLAAAEPDVEAILISRGERDQRGVETFLVPIDACYELAGRMRLLWRGFDGGAEARQSITAFLERVRERSRDLGEEP
jgi:hypothetical protein